MCYVHEPEPGSSRSYGVCGMCRQPMRVVEPGGRSRKGKKTNSTSKSPWSFHAADFSQNSQHSWVNKATTIHPHHKLRPSLQPPPSYLEVQLLRLPSRITTKTIHLSQRQPWVPVSPARGQPDQSRVMDRIRSASSFPQSPLDPSSPPSRRLSHPRRATSCRPWLRWLSLLAVTEDDVHLDSALQTSTGVHQVMQTRPVLLSHRCLHR